MTEFVEESYEKFQQECPEEFLISVFFFSRILQGVFMRILQRFCKRKPSKKYRMTFIKEFKEYLICVEEIKIKETI